MPTDRSPGAATGAAGLAIEGIVAVESPREFRINPRERVVAYTAELAGARQLFTLSLRGTGAPATQITASEKAIGEPSGRRMAGAWPSSATRRSGSSRPTARGSPRWSTSPAEAAIRSGPRMAGGSRSCRAAEAGPRPG